MQSDCTVESRFTYSAAIADFQLCTSLAIFSLISINVNEKCQNTEYSYVDEATPNEWSSESVQMRKHTLRTFAINPLVHIYHNEKIALEIENANKSWDNRKTCLSLGRP